MRQTPPPATRRETDAERHRKILAERIRQKISDYAHYRFSVRETRALNIFFDLAQEYEDLAYLYHLPVQVLQFFFNVRVELFARNEKGDFSLQTSRARDVAMIPPMTELAAGPVQSGAWWFFSAKGRPHDMMAGDYRPGGHPEGPDVREILAVLAIRPGMPLSLHQRLFYEKFTNRLGFSLHNRLLALKNLEHIDFVRTLVHDIGHNVIVPNMHFKLLMRQMAAKLADLRNLSDELEEPDKRDRTRLDALHLLCEKLEDQYQEISKHFQQSSFFLETLLRQSHFDQGRYVLQRVCADLVPRVVAPQVERYRQRMEDRGIVVEEHYPDRHEQLHVDVDVGLISQVLANFLSNAVKYTRETPGIPGYFVRCTVSVEQDAFGSGKHGARVEVLSSGANIASGEEDKLFAESFRASNTDGEEGTGHGLYFSRLIMRQHDGQCGYRRDEAGNVFFIVLPLCGQDAEAKPKSVKNASGGADKAGMVKAAKSGSGAEK